jgi:hypothetical protein
MSTTNRIIGFGAAAVLVILGIASLAVIGGGTGQVVAIVLIGLGCVLAVSLVFFEIGLSEDRDRAREQQAASRKPVMRSIRPRLDRTRGRRRRPR